jgi:hypothetical protein
VPREHEVTQTQQNAKTALSHGHTKEKKKRQNKVYAVFTGIHFTRRFCRAYRAEYSISVSRIVSCAENRRDIK